MNRDKIFLCTDLPLVKVADLLAEVMGTTVNIDRGALVVRRLASGEWKDKANIGGGVYDNYLRDEDAPPDERAVHDSGYDILFDISMVANIPGEIRERLQAQEARQIFNEIIERLPFPAVHEDEGGLLHSAWNPTLGRTDFPPGTTPYAEHRSLWEPYAHPTAPGNVG